MADIYLGPTISGAILLPRIRWAGGGAPVLPADHSKTVNKATVLSGAWRFDIRPDGKKSWPLAWDFLTDAELADLISLDELNRKLWFQNGWEGAGWQKVSIARFEYAPVINLDLCGGKFWPTIYGIAHYGVNYYQGIYTDHHPRFNVQLTLEEAN